jgi:hypothetical protein
MSPAARSAARQTSSPAVPSGRPRPRARCATPRVTSGGECEGSPGAPRCGRVWWKAASSTARARARACFFFFFFFFFFFLLSRQCVLSLAQLLPSPIQSDTQPTPLVKAAIVEKRSSGDLTGGSAPQDSRHLWTLYPTFADRLDTCHPTPCHCHCHCQRRLSSQLKHCQRQQPPSPQV